MKKARAKVEYGDFQTPAELASECCAILARRGFAPASILEPTCGQGNFLISAIETFPNAHKAVGVEINAAHIYDAQRHAKSLSLNHEPELIQGDFFKVDWREILKSLPDPLLILGNPPWVTNSALGALRSHNLPSKSNFQDLRGVEAITGKSNFDISEWMLLRAMEWINGRSAALAMLCKTGVARKALSHAWREGLTIKRADIFHIDALRHFDAAVDACLLVIETSPQQKSYECHIHNELEESATENVLGWRDNRLVADIETYEKYKYLAVEPGQPPFVWRSGVKHDCAKVIELLPADFGFRNGLGEQVDIETDFLYPMMKSSEVASNDVVEPRRWLVVTQKNVGDDTKGIKSTAPKTWQYLVNHAELFDKRASSIYRGRPRFSIFGVGDYSFSAWKIGISGFYKKLSFRAIGPQAGKPVMLDDTCYFLACKSEEEAKGIAGMLNSEIAEQFFTSLIFWDAKRPITIELLKQIDLLTLARQLRVEDSLIQCVMRLRGEGLGNQEPLLWNKELMSEHI